jgi:hypothetical protein
MDLLDFREECVDEGTGNGIGEEAAMVEADLYNAGNQPTTRTIACLEKLPDTWLSPLGGSA